MIYKTKQLNDYLDLLKPISRRPILEIHGLVMPDFTKEKSDPKSSTGIYDFKITSCSDPDYQFFAGQDGYDPGTIMTANEWELCPKTHDFVLDGWINGKMSTVYIHTSSTIQWWTQNRGKKSRKSELFLVDTVGRAWKINDFLDEPEDEV